MRLRLFIVCSTALLLAQAASARIDDGAASRSANEQFERPRCGHFCAAVETCFRVLAADVFDYIYPERSGAFAGIQQNLLVLNCQYHPLDALVVGIEGQRAVAGGRETQFVDPAAARIVDLSGNMLGSQCDQIEIGTRAAIHAVDAVPTAQDVVTAAAIEVPNLLAAMNAQRR